MKRRFWEEDASIYGGHSFTDQDISLVSYPNFDFFKDKPAVLLGAFASGAGGLKLAGMTPEAAHRGRAGAGLGLPPRHLIARSS